MQYTPQPIDTSHVTLPESISGLIERLAENTHEVWAKQRFEEGWVYGPSRNDQEKTHPGLVAYANLSESEKDYDRNTAVETLKLILALGFEIRSK